jgi:phage virion morphogenesis protein
VIIIEVDDSSLKRVFAEVGARMVDMSPLMRQISEKMKNAVDQNFDTEGSRIGPKWKPSQRAIKQGGKTLQDTGRLAASIVPAFDSHSAEVGTNVVYAAIHQFGGTVTHLARSQRAAFKVDFKTGRSRFAKRKNANFEQWVTIGEHQKTMPARPFLGLNNQDIGDIETLAAKFLVP